MLAQVLSFFIKECHLKIRIEINVCVLYFDDLEILLLLRSQSTLSNKMEIICVKVPLFTYFYHNS